jgi:hypothetical protein
MALRVAEDPMFVLFSRVLPDKKNRDLKRTFEDKCGQLTQSVFGGSIVV